ncbi:helix-turn-helix domain-containing protein [Desulfovibrio sp.]|uniref:helix-turn-helix domain-containing protein n=1 Tax=Desulfovibrio sp. TaxID=885 RepID=UPI00345BA1E5
MIRPEHIALEAAARPVRREEAVAAAPADEKQRLLAALEKAAWNISKSARLLGVSRWTLYRRMFRHGLERPGEGL